MVRDLPLKPIVKFGGIGNCTLLLFLKEICINVDMREVFYFMIYFFSFELGPKSGFIFTSF